MEKLIKLLDEYDHKKTEDLERGKQRVEEYKLWIISKQFGFIQRLVENEKIDFQIWKGEKYLEHPIGSDNFDGVHDYKDIIQRLSISDTPIEDLILYLK